MKTLTAKPLDLDLPESQLGEGIHWDAPSLSLWWVDIVGKRIHRYDTATGDHKSWTVSKEVSFVFPNADRNLLVGLSNGVYVFDPETGEERPLALLDLPAYHRLNDGKKDPAGRLWVGTINTSADPSETAALYLLQGDRLEKIEGGYTNANGKAWSADAGIMFHADTGRKTIWAYDYISNKGVMKNKRVFTTTTEGSPDGLEADSNGDLYAAIFGGSRVDVFSPSGDRVGRVELPVPNVTSCCLGGPGRKTLFITTAFHGMSPEARQKAPLSGRVFQCELEA